MAKRMMNLKKGMDEEIQNSGFNKVKIANAPENFTSFDESETTGYLINLDFIQFNNIKTGHDYTKFNAGDTVTFEKDDVYVYDADEKVYYLLGYELSTGDYLYTND